MRRDGGGEWHVWRDGSRGSDVTKHHTPVSGRVPPPYRAAGTPAKGPQGWLVMLRPQTADCISSVESEGPILGVRSSRFDRRVISA